MSNAYTIGFIKISNPITIMFEDDSGGRMEIPVSEAVRQEAIISRLSPEDALLVGVWHGKQERRNLLELKS